MSDRGLTRRQLERIRCIAEQIKEQEQVWARMTINERRDFALSVGASEQLDWRPISDVGAHWLAAQFGQIRACGAGKSP